VSLVHDEDVGFAQIFDRPMAMGTRCHQLAMYVVFESPLQMLADSPSNYLREPEAMEFLGVVPTVWVHLTIGFSSGPSLITQRYSDCHHVSNARRWSGHVRWGRECAERWLTPESSHIGDYSEKR
jgi:hypothetical protein